MHGATPEVLSKAGDVPVGKSASTVGGLVVRSNMTREALPLPTTSVFPSGVTSNPSGPEMGMTPFAREAQHCAPGNPPKLPLSPNPGNLFPKAAKKFLFLQPNRVRPPLAVSGIPVIIDGMFGRHGLPLFPALATWLSPPMVFTAKLFLASVTTTSRPMRSDVYTLCRFGSNQLMSNELNGPPGSPVGLCSGTGITFRTP